MEQKIVVVPKHRLVWENLTEANINDFYMLLDERREQRKGKVSQLVSLLEKGISFESPMVINKTIRGVKRVLDGNHRVEALKIFFTKHPDAKVKVSLALYDNLNREEERMIYSMWNKGTPENAMDFLKNYFKTIPYGEQMLRQLPVTLTNSSDKLSIKNLVGSHIIAKHNGIFSGSYSKNGENTVADFMAIEPVDIKVMKAFVLEYTSVFGEPHRKSKYWRATPIKSFYRIWYDNRSHITPDKFCRALNKVKYEWDAKWEDLAKSGTTQSTEMFYNQMIRNLKGKCPSYRFLSDVDIIDRA